MALFFYVKCTKMLSFFMVAEALTGLIYYRPAGENSSFHILATMCETYSNMELFLKQLFRIPSSTKYKEPRILLSG